MNEHEQFLESLETDQNTGVDILDQPLVEEPEKETGKEDGGEQVVEDGGEGEGDDLKPKNRRERRLLRKLNAERESSIFLAGKLEAREEASRALNSQESDYLKEVERIYGTDTPEAQLATGLLKKALVGIRDDAEARALARYREEREKEQREEQKASKQLETILEDIEDTYDVTLTEAQEKGFQQLLQKMSPKNESGQVVSLADHHAVWEVFQSRIKKPGSGTRAKALSSRSMVASGASKDSTINEDATARFLKESGII